MSSPKISSNLVPMSEKEKIINRVRRLMDDHKVSLYRLEKVCDIPHSSMLSMMNPKSSAEWQLKYLVRVASFFKVTLDYLVSGSDSVADRDLINEVAELKAENSQLKERIEKIDQLKKFIQTEL